MTEIDIIPAIGQVGFPIAVAAFLLWRGYTQDIAFLKVLQDLTTQIRTHTEQKETMVELLQKCQDDLRASYLEMKRFPQK